VTLLLTAFLAVFVPQDDAAPPSGDEILLREIRARGLTQLGEAYSKRRLGNEKLDPRVREAAAVELATSNSRRASAETNAEARRAGWKESDAVIEPWLAAATGVEPEAFEFRLQHGIMIRERAETAVELLKAIPNDKELAADALAQAKAAADGLSKLFGEIRKRSNQLGGGDPKKIAAIHQLDARAKFHAGLAWLAVVTASQPGPERVKAGEESARYIREFADRFSLLPLNLEAILALGRLYKETERYEEALSAIGVYDLHPEAPAVYKQRAELLAAQILLLQNKPSAALAKLNIADDKRLKSSGEWDLTLFEAMLRASRQGVGEQTRRDESLELLASLESKHGGYWKVRGEQALAKFGESDIVGDNPSLLARVANLRRERKEYDAAVQMFDRAAALEKTANAPERAAKMSIAAAASLLEKGDATGAANRYLAIADELGQSELAADALLGAIGALHQTKQSGDAAAAASYKSTLDRLLGLPKVEPGILHEAHWLRGRLAESEKDLTTAVAQYREIPLDHARSPAALEALAVVHHDSMLGENGRIAGEQTRAAAFRDLESRLQASASQPAAGRYRATGAWVLAKMIAEHHPDRLAEAVKLVESAVVVEPSFPLEKNRVWPTLLGWKFKLGDVEGAKAVVNRGFGDDSKASSEALLKFSPLEEGISEKESAARTDVAEDSVQKWLAKADQLPDRTRISFRLLSGQVFAARKDYSSAARVLRQAREEARRDRRIPQVLGRILFLAGEYRESMGEWLLLAKGVRPGEEDWLNAMAEAARCQIELGDRALTADYLKLIDRYPGKGSAAVRKKIDDVRKRMER
jgi:tetratricopeptide (TPR) repeat protein